MSSRAFLVSMALFALLVPGGARPTVAQLRPASLAVAALSEAEGPAPVPGQTQVAQALCSSPVMFIENVGQFGARARFQVRGGPGTMWLTEDAIWITIVERSQVDTLERFDVARASVEREDEPLHGVNLKLSFPDANPHPLIEPFDRLDTVVSYFIGNDPDQWHPNVPVWGGVRYVDLYPGVDLEVTSEGGHWTWHFAVRDSQLAVSNMRLWVEGVDALALDSNRLCLTTSIGDFTLPLLTVEGATPDVHPVTSNAGRGMFEVIAPFCSAPLPPGSSTQRAGASVLLYATFLGGYFDEGYYGDKTIAVDVNGAAYASGTTPSPDFPTTPGTFDTTLDGRADVFVTKLNAAGTQLVYSTFLGGGDKDISFGIAVDGYGSTYITGYTNSSDFPTTAWALDTTCGTDGNCNRSAEPTNSDSFVTKLNAGGNGLIYSTYLGGGDFELGWDIAVDASGAAYATGKTSSSDFPTTLGGFDTTLGGYDAFVTKLNATGSGLIYSTFLGGSESEEWGHAVTVDVSGAAYITGLTYSSDFPTTPGAFDTAHAGTRAPDIFVTKLNVTGSGLVYSTFLGGSDLDYDPGIVIDASRAAYVTGSTNSSDFPTTLGGFDTTLGGYDAFVTKLNATGSGLIYSTFLGGSDFEVGLGIAVDASGIAYVTGATGSSNFPTTVDAFATTLNGSQDAFVTKLDATGSELLYSTYLGGNNRDAGCSISLDNVGGTYLMGGTNSPDFPTTGEAFDTSYNGPWGDVFVAKLAVGDEPAELVAKIQNMTTSTNARLDQVLAEANEIAQDGDYFAVQKIEHEIDLMADAIIDSAGILADGFDAVKKVENLTKIEFPGVIGHGWEHILDLKAGHQAARDAFRDALHQEVTSANARRAAKEFFNGTHIYYAADMLDSAAKDLLGDGMVKYGWKVGLQSDLALQNQVYPAQQRLVNIYKQDVTDTRDETIANMPWLTPEEQQAYIEDLTQRDKANIVMAFTMERRALPLHVARADRESGQENWIASFLAKYLIKGLADLYADGPGVLAVNVGSAFWDLYQNSRQLNKDIQMMNLAVEGMGGFLSAEKRIYLNAVHGMDNIVQGIEPKIAQGSVSSIVNKSEGEYKLFERWFWCERSSYSEVNVSNSTSYDTVYQVIADYGKTGFLGTSYQPLVGEGARAIPGSGSDTVRVQYKQDDEGASPDKASAIEMDLLGSTDTGTYHVTHEGTTWNPARITASGVLQATTQAQAEAPTIPYPIRTRMAVDEDALTYTPYIWVDNPFEQTVVVTLTQPLPTDVQVINANGGSVVGNSLLWQMTINPQVTVEITHVVRYQGDAGQVAYYPEPQLEMTDLGATAYVTFTGETETFIGQPPLSALGTPPAEIAQGESATIPITVINRLANQAASGTVRLSLIDFEAETEVHSDVQAVYVPAGGSQVVELWLDTANVSAGDYLLTAIVESNGGQEEVFAEYLRVTLRLYLPLILRNH
jgi:hypothetical protein